MSQTLPPRADFGHLKGQAKSLLQALKRADPAAIRRSGEPPKASYRLADAQRILAREYGFPSWAKLKRHVEGYADRRTAFFAAIKAGERDMVAKLAKDDPGLVLANDPNEFGAAPLTYAANRKDIGMIDLLLDLGADIDARSDWWAGSFGPLDFADDATSAHLLARGATLTAHAAARLGKAKELKAILRKHPDAVRERGGDGQFPLHFSRTPEIVDILVDAGAELDARDIDHKGTAAQFRVLDKDVLRRLLERGASSDIYMGTVLGDLAMIERHLDEDPDAVSRRPDMPGNPMIPQAPGRHIYNYTVGPLYPVQVAIAQGQQAAYELLFARSSPGQRLMAACWKGDEETARTLVAEDPDLVKRLDKEDRQQIVKAAWEHRTETVKLMLELGWDVNEIGSEHMTPIQCAGFHGFDDVMDLLLPYGPDLTIKNAFGGLPLGCCLYGSIHSWRTDGNFPRCVELLIQAGAELPKEEYGSEEARAVLRRYGAG